MIKIEIVDKLDRNEVVSFLEHVEYKKFDLYPGVSENQIRNYLLEELDNSYKNDKVFVAYSGSDIVSIVILKDLDWDTQHFGYKCAILSNIFVKQFTESFVLSKLITVIVNYAIESNIEFISGSINSWDTNTSFALQEIGFKYIITWIDGINKSKQQLSLNNMDNEIGIIRDSELEYYRKIASTSYFKGGRFYFDSKFDDDSVEKMYSSLIESSYKNNDIMLSYRIDGNPVGLFICRKIQIYKHFNDLKIAPLRYLIIDPKIRKLHIGYDLFAGTLNYLMDICDIITTGLEIHNLPSLNLHSKLNFKFNYTHNVFHWWGK